MFSEPLKAELFGSQLTVVRILIILLTYWTVAAVGLIADSVLVLVVAGMTLGVIMYGFLNAAHDCVHCTHMATKRGNQLAGRIWCMPIFVNYTLFRIKHLAHHRSTGLEDDPDPPVVLESIVEYLLMFLGPAHWRYTFRSYVSVFRGNLPRYVLKPGDRNAAQRDAATGLAWGISVSALTLLFPWELFVVYWLPLFCYVPAMVFFSLPEHYGCERTGNVENNTRSIESNVIVRFFLWNANFHAEHHAFPNVPSDKLFVVHKGLVGNLNFKDRSYVAFHLRVCRGLLTEVR